MKMHVKLGDFMICKFLFTKVSFNEDELIIKRFILINVIKYTHIKQLIIEKPKFYGFPGNGFSYYYNFYIKADKKSIDRRFSLVFNFDDTEYNDLIELLSKKNIEIIEREYDNRPDFGD